MPAPKVHLVRIDPYSKTSGMLVPAVTQRILDAARAYTRELAPEAYARAIMTRLWARDPGVAVVALLAETPSGPEVVGHAVATIEEGDGRRWVYISQAKADGNVGDAMTRAIRMADEWAAALGIEDMTMSTVRSDAAFKRRYTFDVMRTLMIRKVGSPIHQEGSDPA